MAEVHQQDTPEFLAQQDAKDELSLDPIPDMPAGKLTVKIGDNPPAYTQVEGLLYGPFGLYPDPEGTNPTSEWAVMLLVTGRKVVSHADLAPFGMVRQQARRFAVWLSALDWRVFENDSISERTVDLARQLIHTYKLRDWIKVKEIVEKIGGRLVDKPNGEYTTPVENETPTTLNPVEETRMSTVNAPQPTAVNGVQTETAPKAKRGRRKRDPNSKAAITRPGVQMKPVANFNADTAEKFAQEFGEKVPLVYAAGIYVLTQLPIEQQMEALKQAKIENVKNIRAERAAQGEGAEASA